MSGAELCLTEWQQGAIDVEKCDPDWLSSFFLQCHIFITDLIIGNLQTETRDSQDETCKTKEIVCKQKQDSVTDRGMELSDDPDRGDGPRTGS